MEALLLCLGELNFGMRPAILAQIYELIAALLIVGWIWFRKADSRPGILFLTFAALTAAARLFLEAFRGDSTLIFGGLRLAQIIAWVVLAAALFASEIASQERQRSIKRNPPLPTGEAVIE